jgi:enoyl-CoA hydratase/carnithine racemase
MSKFDEYCNKYQYIKMKRSDGILQMTFHSKGKELLWGGRPHEEASYAFYEIARDRDNRAVIITGTGESFCADIIWGRASEMHLHLQRQDLWRPTILCRMPII